MSLDRGTRARLAAVGCVAIGNVLEIYTVVVVAYLATWWANTYFPNLSAPLRTTLAVTIFIATYLARPLGAIVLGATTDRLGRRAGLVVTFAALGATSLVLALLPGYRSLGIVAPLVIALMRVLQAMTVDAEEAAAAAYLLEIAPADREGFCVAWVGAGHLLAIPLALLAGKSFAPSNLGDPQWRIPLLIGAAALAAALAVRVLLIESPSWTERSNRPRPWTIVSAVCSDWRTLGVAVLAAALLPVLTRMIDSFVPQMVRLALGDVVTVANAALFSAAVWAVFFGWLSDKIGRRRLLRVGLVVSLLTIVPAILWLHAAPSLAKLWGVQLWLALILGAYGGVLFTTLAAMMPVEVRVTALALALGLAAIIFGSLNGIVFTAVIRPGQTGLAPAGALVLLSGWLIIVVGLCLLAIGKIDDRLLAQTPPTIAPDSPAIGRNIPAAVDDPNWREKLMAALSDTGVGQAAPGSYWLRRIGLIALAIVLLAVGAIVARYVIPGVFRRDPQGEFFASIIWLIFSVLALSRPTVSLIRRSWQAGARRAEEELQRAGSRRPIFYLRSFDLDSKIGRTSIVELLTGRAFATAEQSLAKRMRRSGPVIAIGRPDEKLPALGAARFYVSHDRWKDKVADVAKASQLVVWATGTTEGLRWEISHLLDSLPPEKLIIWAHPHLLRLLPPQREVEWQKFLAALGSVFPHPLPSHLGITRFFHFDKDYRPIPEVSLRAVLKAKRRSQRSAMAPATGRPPEQGVATA